MWYIHKVAYYSPSRVILTHATAWIHLEDIILSEVSQTQLTNTVRVHFYDVLRVVTFTETKV